jgi:hypothetical protein
MAKMSTAEIIEEVDWLLGGGMTPFQVAEALERSPGALFKAAWRAGRKDLSTMFGKMEHAERRVAAGEYWKA